MHALPNRRLLTNVALIAALTTSLSAPAARAANRSGFDWDNGYRIAAGPVRADLGLTLNFDYGQVRDDTTGNVQQSLLRRLRPSIGIDIGSAWSARVDYELGDTSRGIKNAWLQWRPMRGLALRVGSQAVTFGLDGAIGSQDYPFLERPIASALGPGLLVGGELTLATDAAALSLGYYRNNVGDEDRRAMQGRSMVLRASGNPLRGDKGFWHIGISGELRQADTGADFRLDPRPESYLDQTRLIDTGRLANADQLLNVGLETALQHGPAVLEAEYLVGHLTRTGGAADADFKGWTGSFAWAITGERRRYQRLGGGFGGIKPKHRWGALELALRASELDLNDDAVLGGVQRTYTAGVNYYWRERIRLMLSYARSDATTRRQVDVSRDVIAARLQASF